MKTLKNLFQSNQNNQKSINQFSNPLNATALIMIKGGGVPDDDLWPPLIDDDDDDDDDSGDGTQN
ncbi:MAG: hypothetical protein U9P82_12665 [Bacteroidota bacterium]|nr:hypothetical protein [Bacteroidota bacterium]